MPTPRPQVCGIGWLKKSEKERDKLKLEFAVFIPDDKEDPDTKSKAELTIEGLPSQVMVFYNTMVNSMPSTWEIR